MLQELISLLQNPLLWKILISYWVFSAVVGALPDPNGNKWYRFFYGFMHGLAANIMTAARQFKVPGANP